MKTVVDAVNELKGDLSCHYSEWAELLGFAECIVGYQDAGEPAVSIGDIRPIYIEYSPSMLRIICTIEEFNQCVAEMSEAKWIPEKESKPIYTKAMQEAGEPPTVEMECEARSACDDDWYPVTILYASSHGFVVDDFRYAQNEQWIHKENVEFRPIQTEREKMIGKAINHVKGEYPLCCEETVVLMVELGYKLNAN